jgi:hypothetical protein
MYQDRDQSRAGAETNMCTAADNAGGGSGVCAASPEHFHGAPPRDFNFCAYLVRTGKLSSSLRVFAWVLIRVFGEANHVRPASLSP